MTGCVQVQRKARERGTRRKDAAPGDCMLGHRVKNHVTVIGWMERYRKNVAKDGFFRWMRGYPPFYMKEIPRWMVVTVDYIKG